MNNIRFTIIWAIAFFAGVILLDSCYYDIESELYPPVEMCDSIGVVSYSMDVVPILNEHCNGCHSQSSATAGIILEGYGNVSTYVNNGELSCTINHEPGCEPMPLNGAKIWICDIETIESWISDGAPDN